MKIEIGKYTLISDSQCYWITRKYKTKKNTEGKLRVSGYARTFEELIHSFMECRLRDSDAENLKDLMHDVENIKQDAEEIVKEYFKNYRA